MLRSIPLTLLLTACNSTALMDAGKLYKKEVDMTVNGHKAKGVQAELKSPTYKITFELPEKPSVVKVTTCHREETFRDVGKQLEYVYSPVRGLEDTGYCPLELGAFDVNGAHSWGMVDFQDGESLPALINCSGAAYRNIGVSICQSRSGLIQSIKFDTEVKSSTHSPCLEADTKDRKSFQIEASRDKCIYFFTNGKETHRLTIFGYDEVFIK